MKLSKVFVAALLSALFSPAISSAATYYTIVDLGRVEVGASRFSALSINNNGMVAGTRDTGNRNHAFTYQGGVTTDLDAADGYSSVARDINDNGQVTGTTRALSGSPDRAFLYSNGTMQVLGTFGGSYSSGYGINDLGQVTGSAYTAGDATYDAFVFDNSLQDIGSLSPGRSSEGSAINAAGQVAGYGVVANGMTHAFFYDGTMHDLGTLGGLQSNAYDLNQSGQVVGAAMLPDGVNSAFLYSGGVMHDLGTLGAPSSSAYDINDAGQIVGAAGVSGTIVHAFLYENGVMKDLNNWLVPNTGVSLRGATGINNLGQIVAYGTVVDDVLPNGTFYTHGFLLSPVPEPSSIVLGAAGALTAAGGCWLRRRRNSSR